MSDLIKQARSLLLASSPVTDVVSSRVSAMYREQTDALPSIVLELDSVDPDAGTGLSGTATMLRAEITVACFSETLAVGIDLAQKSAAALGGSRGTNSDGKQYAAAASISVDSVTTALSGKSSGPVFIEVDLELYLEV